MCTVLGDTGVISMARRKRSKRRDASVSIPTGTANRQVDHAIKKILARPALALVDDRRFHHPDGRARPAKKINGTRLSQHKVKGTRIKVHRGRDGRPMKSVIRIQTIPSRIKFATPKRVAICVRRKIRREVLLALGRGGGHHRKPKRNRYSEVSC